MRVVHVHRIRGIGGSERHVLNLLPALARLGVEVRFLGLDDPAWDPEPFYELLEGLGIESLRLDSPRDVDPKLAVSVARSLRALRPDLVHTHLVHADVYGTLAAVAAGSRLVSTKHNDDPFRTGPFRFVERALVRRAACVIAITHALERFSVERVGLPATKIQVVHYGLDAPPEPWGENRPVDLPRGARVLLAVSRLAPQKGVDDAVRALARLRGDHRDAVLVVLGEGPQRQALEALARELGIAEAVFLPGRAGDVAAWLRQAELLVHPVRWEGFGLAVLEAMLAGLPVLATRVSALPEIVVDRETGLLVPPDDPIALAAAASALLSDGERARRYGEAGLARARNTFSVERMARRTLAIYESARSRNER